MINKGKRKKIFLFLRRSVYLLKYKPAEKHKFFRVTQHSNLPFFYSLMTAILSCVISCMV